MVHVVIFVALLAVPAGVVRRAERRERTDVVFYRPQAEIAPPIVKPAEPRRPPEPPPKKPAIKPPAVEPPRPAPAPRSAPPPPRVERQTPPESAPTAPAIAARPEPPRPKVRTDVFRDAPPATPAAPKTRQTRTGTFSEPPSVLAQQSSRARTSARVGGFETPAAPAAAVDPPRERAVTTAGFGDGVAVAEIRDTRAPSQARVSSAGFGDGVASADSGRARSANTGSVKQGQFGDGLVAAEAPRPKERSAAKADTPVEIISKPKPNYTDEARRLRVEGEVVLEVIFVSSGQLRVLGVLQTLGHGLDEAAIEAARSIEFKPARRNGQPVDHAATLHIVFQLA